MSDAMPPTPQFSIHRAFVVQFHDGTDAAHGQVSGRVEHIVTGQVSPFQSWQELQAFVARILAQAGGKSSPSDDSPR